MTQILIANVINRIDLAKIKMVSLSLSFLYLKFAGVSLDIHYEYEYDGGRKVAGPLSPLMQQDSAQL